VSVEVRLPAATRSEPLDLTKPREGGRGPDGGDAGTGARAGRDVVEAPAGRGPTGDAPDEHMIAVRPADRGRRRTRRTGSWTGIRIASSG
jgi:hypothetical protein